jgi:hypothetical protein
MAAVPECCISCLLLGTHVAQTDDGAPGPYCVVVGVVLPMRSVVQDNNLGYERKGDPSPVFAPAHSFALDPESSPSTLRRPCRLAWSDDASPLALGTESICHGRDEECPDACKRCRAVLTWRQSAATPRPTLVPSLQKIARLTTTSFSLELRENPCSFQTLCRLPTPLTRGTGAPPSPESGKRQSVIPNMSSRQALGSIESKPQPCMRPTQATIHRIPTHQRSDVEPSYSLPRPR